MKWMKWIYNRRLKFNKKMYKRIYKKYFRENGNTLFYSIINALLTLKEIIDTTIMPCNEKKYYLYAKNIIQKRMKKEGYDFKNPKEIENVEIQQAWYEFLEHDPERN